MANDVPEMVERVARHLAALQSIRAWEDEAPADREMYRSRACAAIEAMREPTGEMIRPMQKPPRSKHDHTYLTADSAATRWQCGVDAALGKEQDQ